MGDSDSFGFAVWFTLVIPDAVATMPSMILDVYTPWSPSPDMGHLVDVAPTSGPQLEASLQELVMSHDFSKCLT